MTPPPPPPFQPSATLSVQHEEHGAGAALPGLRGDGEAARPAALPAQCVSAVRGRSLGAARLPSAGPSSGAPLTGVHAQHALPETGTTAHAQDP